MLKQIYRPLIYLCRRVYVIENYSCGLVVVDSVLWGLQLRKTLEAYLDVKGMPNTGLSS